MLTPEEFCIFLPDPDPGPDSDPEYKIWEKLDPEPDSLFIFGSGRRLCGNFSNENTSKIGLDLLSSFWLVNLKRLMTLKQQGKKTSII